MQLKCRDSMFYVRVQKFPILEPVLLTLYLFVRVLARLLLHNPFGMDLTIDPRNKEVHSCGHAFQ